MYFTNFLSKIVISSINLETKAQIYKKNYLFLFFFDVFERDIGGMKLLFVLLQAILVITGASSMDELDETTVERFDYFAVHPLNINAASAAKLVSSGLFSSYQAASILEYRSRTGDIVSVAELSAVDGIGQRYADALREYVAFDMSRPVGTPGSDSLRISHNLTVRTQCRTDDWKLSGGFKYSVGVGNNAGLFWASRITRTERNPGPGIISGEYFGRHWQFVAGDFGMRLGQGLLVWSGFSMSGVGSAAALSRNASGLYASHSSSPMFRGAGASFSYGEWTGTAAFAWPFAALGCVRCRFGRMDAGLNVCLANGNPGVSGDFRIGFNGWSLFGECAWCGAPAAAAGVYIVPAYGTVLSVQLRYLPTGYSAVCAGPVSSTGRKKDEYGISAAFQSDGLSVTADASYKPSLEAGHFRLLSERSWRVPLGPSAEFEPSVRAALRFHPRDKDKWRGELRSDLGFSAGRLGATLRCHALWCTSLAWMTYVEASFKSAFSAYLRAGLFRVDNWNDRIYCYERDAPGNFNNQALYGRGWNASAFVSWKVNRVHSLYLRLSAVAYPWSSGRQGYGEARIQYALNLLPRKEFRYGVDQRKR